jgi:hypothetical protein
MTQHGVDLLSYQLLTTHFYVELLFFGEEL